MNNSFYDDNDLREIDEQIGEVIGQPTLVDKMQERSDKVSAARTNWANEFKQHWYIYVPLLVSAVFTAMLGVYMGLAPYIKPELDGSKTLTFNTDWAHIFTALIYVVSFLYVTEISFAIYHHLFHKREEGNNTQTGTMLFGMILSGISIIGTGVSGGMVVSSTLGFLTEFKEIPPSAQKWVVAVIPVMLGLYAGLLISYKLSSRKAKAERIARENDEKLELDNQVRMKGIQAIGKRRIQAAAIRTYERLVMDGLMSQSEAEWALNSGLSLYEIEKKLGRDLTGDRKIGAPGASKSTAAHPTPKYDQAWKDSTDITPTLDAYAWVCSNCEGTNQSHTKACQWCGQARTNGSAVTALPNMPPHKTPRTYTADDLCALWNKSRLDVGEIFSTYNNANHFYSYSEARTNWLPKDMSRENFADIFEELLMDYQLANVLAEPSKNTNGHKKPNP